VKDESKDGEETIASGEEPAGSGPVFAPVGLDIRAGGQKDKMDSVHGRGEHAPGGVEVPVFSAGAATA